MGDLSLKLQAFEGPLDLLMHLIEREKVDIYDIPIVSITQQYLEYLSSLREFDMEIASEFLVMAATLLQIKSRMLLPKEEQQEEEEEDPRQQLVEMLVEYRRIKAYAAQLQELKAQADRYCTRPPMFKGLVNCRLAKYTVADLLLALSAMEQEELLPEVTVTPQTYSVREKMAAILQQLQLRRQGLSFADLWQQGRAGEQVAAFLAVLELLRGGKIMINQSVAFGPIYIFSREGEQVDGKE